MPNKCNKNCVKPQYQWRKWLWFLVLMRHVRYILNDVQRTMSEFQDLIYVAANFRQSNVHQTRYECISMERNYFKPNTLVKHLQVLLGTNKDKCLFVHTY